MSDIVIASSFVRPGGCSVHPGWADEIRTIGLSQRTGQSHRDAYAEWCQLRRGEKCSCEERGHFTITHFKVKHDVWICATWGLVDGSEDPSGGNFIDEIEDEIRPMNNDYERRAR